MKNLNLYAHKKETTLQTSNWYFIAFYLVISILLFSCEKEETEDKIDTSTTAENEPNDNFEQAATLHVDSLINAKLSGGEFSETQDNDYYHIITSQSTIIDNNKIFVDNYSDVNLLVTIYSSDKSSVGEVWYPGTSADATFYFHTNSPDFYVSVTGKDASTYPADYSIMVEPMNDYDEFEPNNEINSASIIPLDEEKNCSFLQGDVDYYKIEKTSSNNIWEIYDIVFTNNSDINPLFQAYNNDKTAIESSEIWYPGQSSDFTYRLAVKSGSENARYIKITGKDGIGTNGTCNYKLKVVSKNMNDDNEPDDTFENAREITSFPSGNISGTIVCETANDNGGDYEFFKFTVKAGKKVEFSIDPETSDTELHMTAYKEDRSSIGGLDGGDGETLNYYLNNPGSEDIVIYLELGAYPGENGNYTISFTETIAD